MDPEILEAKLARATGRAGYWLPVMASVYALVANKIHDPNVVKVLRAGDDRAITFTRSCLPNVRDLHQE